MTRVAAAASSDGENAPYLADLEDVTSLQFSLERLNFSGAVADVRVKRKEQRKSRLPVTRTVVRKENKRQEKSEPETVQPEKAEERSEAASEGSVEDTSASDVASRQSEDSEGIIEGDVEVDGSDDDFEVDGSDDDLEGDCLDYDLESDGYDDDDEDEDEDLEEGQAFDLSILSSSTNLASTLKNIASTPTSHSSRGSPASNIAEGKRRKKKGSTTRIRSNLSSSDDFPSSSPEGSVGFKSKQCQQLGGGKTRLRSQSTSSTSLTSGAGAADPGGFGMSNSSGNAARHHALPIDRRHSNCEGETKQRTGTSKPSNGVIEEEGSCHVLDGIAKRLQKHVLSLAYEFDKLQFRTVELQEQHESQDAALTLRERIHHKDASEKGRLLDRHKEIKERIQKENSERVLVSERTHLYGYLLQRATKQHLLSTQKMRDVEEKVKCQTEACDEAKNEQIEIFKEINGLKAKKLHLLSRCSGDIKRKNEMIEFRKSELHKLRSQTESMMKQSLLKNSDEHSSEEAQMEQIEELINVSASPVEQLVVLFQSDDPDTVINKYNASFESIQQYHEERGNIEARLKVAKKEKESLQEVLEMLQLTGRGIFMERDTGKHHNSLIVKLEKKYEELLSQRRRLQEVKQVIRELSQGFLQVLARAKERVTDLPILTENSVSFIKQQRPQDLNSMILMASEMGSQDILSLAKHFEEVTTFIHKQFVKNDQVVNG